MEEKGIIERYREYLEEKAYSSQTIRSVRYILITYEGYIRWNYDKSIDKATEGEITEYCKARLERLSRRTMLKELRYLRSFYKYCYRQGLTLYDVGERVEIYGRKDFLPRDVPSEDKVKCLLDQPCEYTSMGIRDKAILELMYSAGLRRKEIIGLKVSDIDMKENVVIVRRGKGGKGRVLPVGREAIRCIERYLEKSRPEYAERPEEDHLFLTRERGPLSPNTVNGMFRRYRDRSKETKGIMPHSLRHACGLHMLRGGAPIEKIQEMLGHKRLVSTQIYTRLYPEDLKKAHRKAHPREKAIKALNIRPKKCKKEG